ncbi:MAG: hypothetical protein H0W24_01505 [Lysobacter sp.]|nr:hypothetical protein [Lysobacter sp.]MDQ3269460.1 hypothetical protein [Pseudomonadota bacterium]
MSVNNPWAMALPVADTEKVVRTFVDEFHALALAEAGEFAFAQLEKDITRRLTVHLHAVLADTLKSGFWDFEISTACSDMTDFRRLDITYSTVRDDKNARLIFECKKLYAGNEKKAKAARRYYVDHGVHRFVRGSYAPMDSAAFLVGFVATVGQGELKNLRASLASTGTRAAMRLRDYGSKRYWRSPPALFAQHADFETCHLRDKPYPEITLYHLELPFS